MERLKGKGKGKLISVPVKNAYRGSTGIDPRIINQLFTSAQHLLLLTIGLHVSTDHSVIFRSLICCKF